MDRCRAAVCCGARRVVIELRSEQRRRAVVVVQRHDAGRDADLEAVLQELLNEDDTFKTTDQLIDRLAQAGITSDSDDEIVTYCRLSHRATLAWFTMQYILGLDNVRIYDGSWTEWGSIVGFPIEK